MLQINWEFQKEQLSTLLPQFEIFELGGPRTVLEIDDFFLATSQNVTEVSFRTNLYGFLEL